MTDQYIEVGGLYYDKPTFLEALRNTDTLKEYQNYAKDVYGFDGESLQNVMSMINNRINEIGNSRDYQMSPAGNMPSIYFGGNTGNTLVKVKGKNGQYYYNYAASAADNYISHVLSKQKAIPKLESSFPSYAFNKSAAEKAEEAKKEAEAKKETAQTEEEKAKAEAEAAKAAEEAEYDNFKVPDGVTGNSYDVTYRLSGKSPNGDYIAKDFSTKKGTEAYAEAMLKYNLKNDSNLLKNITNLLDLSTENNNKAAQVWATDYFNNLHNKTPNNYNNYLKIMKKYNWNPSQDSTDDGKSFIADLVLSQVFNPHLKQYTSEDLNQKNFSNYFYSVPYSLQQAGYNDYYILPGQLDLNKEDNPTSLLTAYFDNDKVIFQQKAINDILKDIKKVNPNHYKAYVNHLKKYKFKQSQTQVSTQKNGGNLQKLQWGDNIYYNESSPEDLLGETQSAKQHGISIEGAHNRNRRVNDEKATIHNPDAGMQWRDYVRLAGTVADLGSMVSNMTVAGAPAAPFVGLFGTALSSVADWTDDSVGWGEALFGTGLGLATDVASFIPEAGAAAKSAKVVRNLGKLLPVVGIPLAAAGLGQSVDAMKKIVNGEDWTAEDLRKALIGLQALMSIQQGTKGALNSYREPKGFKPNANKIALEVTDKSSNSTKNLIFEGDDVAKIKQAYNDGNLDEVVGNLTYNKNYKVNVPENGFSKVLNEDKKWWQPWKAAENPVPYKTVLEGPEGKVIVKGRDSMIPWRNTSDASYKVTKNTDGDITEIAKQDINKLPDLHLKTKTSTKEDVDLDFTKLRAKAKENLITEKEAKTIEKAKSLKQQYESQYKNIKDDPFNNNGTVKINGKSYSYDDAIKVTKQASGTDGKEVAKELSKKLTERAINKAKKIINKNSLEVQMNGKTYDIDQSYIDKIRSNDILQELQINKQGGSLDFKKMTKFVNKYGSK